MTSPLSQMRKALGAKVGGLVAGLLALGLFAAPINAAPLVVQVVGIRQSVGLVRAEVCTARTFLTQSCEFSADAPASKDGAQLTFPELPAGVYAVQLFHDVHGDGRLRTGAFGIPLEGVGFSNDAPIGLGGPRFSKAQFVHGENEQAVKVTLRFLLGAGPR